MKKFAFILLIIPAISFASFDTNLKYGDRGEKVTELQEFLIDKSLLNSATTGNFYSLTLRAVKDYQSVQGLPSTGFFGPLTREKANTELAINDQAELEETGAINPSTDTTEYARIQAQINEVLRQFGLISDQQKQLTQETNQRLGAIQENTSPIPSVVPISQSIPTSIKIDQTEGDLFSGNLLATCTQQNFDVSVLDENNEPIQGQQIIFTNPDTQQKISAITVPAGSSNGISFIKARISGFIPQQTKTYDLTFISGNISKTIKLNSRSPFSYFRNSDGTFNHITERKGNYLRTDEGQTIDATTGMCVSNLIYNNL